MTYAFKFTTNQSNLIIYKIKILPCKYITLEQLKLHPIIDQTGTYIYKASKVVAKYLGPLAKNEYTIRDTLIFPDLLKSVPSDDNYEDVSYDVESLFTSIPAQETIDYIVYKIYVKKELKPFCKKSIFKRLLNKLTTDVFFLQTTG